MKKSRRRILDRLERAQRRGRPVRIERDRVHDGQVGGFVLAVTRRWVALEVLHDGLFPDGIAFVRPKHVTRVRKGDHWAYAERVLAGHGHVMPHVRLPDDARTRDVLQVASDRGPMIAFHLEHEEDGPLMVGHLVDLADDGFTLRFIDPAGEWEHPELREFAYGEVTRIDVGTQYVQALADYGDPAPEGA
jgi:hypothetical protein